jgi:peptide/nickel transport system substrate-binding protein
MRLFYVGFAATLVVLLANCGSDMKKNIAPAANSLAPPAVDYAALEQKARSFIPAIGRQGGTMTLAVFADPISFNPITSTEGITNEFTDYMYEGLVRINGVTGLPEPALAESWESADSGLTWTFHLRPGVLWSDSVPFSAWDVAFTLNDLVFNETITPNAARDMLLIEGRRFDVTVVDSLTIRFTLPVPYAPFLRAMSQEILPKHAYERLVKSKRFASSLGIRTPPAEMVCTGPFVLESYISSERVVFRRNPLYWRTDSAGTHLPYLDKIIYTIVPDQNVELLRFLNGEIDYISAKGEDFPALKKSEAAGNYTVHRLGPQSGSHFICFNQNSDINPKTGTPFVDQHKQRWFRDKSFRKAVAHALDKESMIRMVMNGLGYPQWGPMSPAEGYFYNPKVSRYPYDIAAAKKLLAANGVADRNNDGLLEDSAGVTVEFSFITNSGNNVRVKLAEIICKNLEQLGFKVDFQLVEFNALIWKIDNPPFAWDAVLLGLSGGPEPHAGRNIWNSGSALHMWFPNEKTPSTPWEACIDSLFDAGDKELDQAKRKKIYDEWQAIAADELPLIYTVLPERIYCIQNRFKNINPAIAGGMLHNVERIWVE